MMKKKNIILLLFSIFVFSANAQTSGLYGKRNYLELNGLGNFRLFGLFLDEGEYYKPSGNNVIAGKDIFDVGFRATLGRVISNNFAFGLEVGMDYQSIGQSESYFSVDYTDQWGTTYYQSVNLHHEMLDTRTTSFMPKFSFTKKGGLLPIGLNHEIGVGFNSTKVIEKDYNFRITSGAEYLSAQDSIKIDQRFVDYKQSYSGFTLMYAFKIKTPVSKKVMINYGLRYTLNLRNFGEMHANGNQTVESNYSTARNIGRMRISNLMSFNLGLSYAF
jgi:hypothetical protein